MRKFLLFAGIFTVLAYNVATAREYYEDNGYYEEAPRYVRRRAEPRYSEETPRYERRSYQSHHYKPISREQEREYRDRQYYESENRIRPYIGLDVMKSKIKPKDSNDKDFFKDKLTSGNIVLGARLNENIGIEAFYQKSEKEDKEMSFYFDDICVREKSTISYKAYGADIQYYIPVNQDFELLASLGLAQYDFTAKAQVTFTYSPYYLKEDFDSMGIRFGLGGQYYLTDNLALRLMARYVKMDDDEYVKSLTEFSLGLRYMF